jgi:acyl-CoA dehydrogenase
LGPGRIHDCMRAVGGSERALELMCRRAQSRSTHGSALAEEDVVQTWIAESRMEVEQARQLVLYTAWKMGTVGKKQARQETSMVKPVAASVFQRV